MSFLAYSTLISSNYILFLMTPKSTKKKNGNLPTHHTSVFTMILVPETNILIEISLKQKTYKNDK